MSAALQHDARPSMVYQRPLPGVMTARFSGDRPLMSAVPAHYGTTTYLSGRSEWSSRGTQWSSGPGSIGVKVPGEVLVERAREGTLDVHVVMFDAARFEEARAMLGRRVDLSRPSSVDPADPRARPLLALHHRLLRGESAAALEEATCEALHALVDVVCAPPGAGQVRTFSAAVTRARALLDERFTETIDLDELAAHARLDKFRLCRAFREQVGLPPHAYVTHRRVSLAQDLLAQGVPQAEVAARVGFYDQSLLHRHFKRLVRLTPGAFVRGH